MTATTIEIPLNAPFDNRPQTNLNSTTNINGILNVVGACNINTVEDDGYITARPPLEFKVTVGIPNGLFAATPGEAYVLDNTSVTYVSSTGTTVLGAITNTGPYTFAASPLPLNVMFKSLTSAYYRNGATYAPITDPNYLAIGATVPGVVCLDGTYYVMDLNSAIWGSNLNDASTWSALNRINAWQDRSTPVALIQHRSYVVALKSASMQVFYDAGNAVGSPLLPLLAAQQPVGCVEASTIQNIRGDTFWVATMQDVGICVVQMSNLQISKITTHAVERWLQAQYALVGGIYAFGYKGVFQASSFSAFGHTFYMLQPVAGGPAAVYDASSKKWAFWYFPATLTSVFLYSCFCINVGFAGGENPTTFFQTTQGYFYFLDTPGVTNSLRWYDFTNGSVFGAYPVQITTPIIDGGTQAEKTAMRLEIFSDNQQNGSLEVSWSDDDYNSWSMPVTVPMTDVRVFFDDLGTFRRRAFRFKHLSTTPFRIQRVVLNVLVGSS